MMAAARRRFERLRFKTRLAIRRQTSRFLASLDDEKIGGFQIMYYWLILSAGMYLLVVASGPPQLIDDTLDSPYYEGWLLLNIFGPIATLVGKRMTTTASGKEPHEKNSAVPGAWLQLTGDLMVWGAICIYILCVFNTQEWGRGIYGAFFVLMGVPGGFMFTLRSWRRIRQIRQRVIDLAP